MNLYELKKVMNLTYVYNYYNKLKVNDLSLLQFKLN